MASAETPDYRVARSVSDSGLAACWYGAIAVGLIAYASVAAPDPHITTALFLALFIALALPFTARSYRRLRQMARKASTPRPLPPETDREPATALIARVVVGADAHDRLIAGGTAACFVAAVALAGPVGAAIAAPLYASYALDNATIAAMFSVQEHRLGGRLFDEAHPSRVERQHYYLER